MIEADAGKLEPESEEFKRGVMAAEKVFHEDGEYVNPFPEGTDAWRGYEEGFYIFTQK